MDPTIDIKARLPIETLVGQYCHLQKKGRGFVCLCPFHKDTHPSLLVSPDKGIAYCFACQKGGDIFSFYQTIEGVDFREALRDLGEKVGIKISMHSGSSLPKDEKERLRQCLDASAVFFCHALKQESDMRAYMRGRGVTEEEEGQFGIGFAQGSGRALYEHLLTKGFSRTVIKMAGLAIQRDLKDEHMRDYFRHRIIFPIHDGAGRVVGFGGRAMREGDPKYMNSPDSSLYRKSAILFNLHRAKEYIREKREVILVEGYFDVLAVVRAGFGNVISPCGTALTEEHVRLMKRCADTVILLLDQDRAGQEAAERSFILLSQEGVQVRSILLPKKDPADLAQDNLPMLTELLRDGGRPYLELVFKELDMRGASNDAAGKRHALDRIIPLILSISSMVEREYYIAEAASVFGTTETALQADIHRAMAVPTNRSDPLPSVTHQGGLFATVEIALGLLLLYPQYRELFHDLIVPTEGIAKVLYALVSGTNEGISFDCLIPDISKEYRERIGILQLFCEEHFSDWTDSFAVREIKRNIRIANQDAIRIRQKMLKEEILRAKKDEKHEDVRRLEVQYQEVIKLRKMAVGGI
ncbi:DNA primase [Candidatus Peregrinibacteria bacterium]|nr:DNA primase [Candidatus Peregrinibacteria bacterium]